MTIGPDSGELLEGHRPRFPARPARPGRRFGRSLTRAALVVGAVALGGYGAAIVRNGGLPPVPDARVRSFVGLGLSQLASWRADDDGRPDRPVQLSPRVELEFGKPLVTPLEILGLAGPGLAPRSMPAARVEAGASTVAADLPTDVDCDRLPDPLPLDALGVRVRVFGGGQSRDAVIAAGDAGIGWGGWLRASCATYLAQRDLTVTAISGGPAATGMGLDLRLTVSNTGDRAMVLVDQNAFPRDTRPGLLGVVPAEGSVTVLAPPLGDDCQILGMPPIRSWPGLHAAATTPSGFARLESTIRSFWSSDDSPVGLPTDAGVSQRLITIVDQVCSGIPGVVVEPLTNERVAFDSTTRLLTVRVTLRLPPGKATAVRLRPDPAVLDDTAQPVAPTTGWATVDGSGRATVVLRYRVPTDPGCLVPVQQLGAELRLVSPTGPRRSFPVALPLTDLAIPGVPLCGLY